MRKGVLKLVGLLIAVVVISNFVSCSNDSSNDKPEERENEIQLSEKGDISLEVAVIKKIGITITSYGDGDANPNDKVEIECDNKDIVSAELKGYNIFLTPKKAGTAVLKVSYGNATPVKVNLDITDLADYTNYIEMTASEGDKDVKIGLMAKEEDKAGVWIDLNNNGIKDPREGYVKFTKEYRSAKIYELGDSETFKVYGKVFSIEVGGGDVAKLDVSHNPELTYLSCWNNQLKKLDVSNNKKLVYLFCNDNQLTNLDVSENKKLKWFILFGNKLTSLDISKNKELDRLDCSDNKLMNLDTSNNIKLSSLRCENNQLTSLDITKNEKLTELKSDLTCIKATQKQIDANKYKKIGKYLKITCP